MSSEPIAYLKGEYVLASECRLSIYDLGIVLGAAVTDFFRTFNHEPFRLEEHVRRFYRSCRYARIAPPITVEESMTVSRKLVEHNTCLFPEHELGLIYYMTAGENLLYAGSAAAVTHPEPTYVQHTFPLRCECWRDVFLKGIHCVTPAARHLPPQCLSSKVKHRNRLHMWIGEQEVHEVDPKAMPLFLDIDGNITETGGSNFVVYRDGIVVSPRPHNILWGESLEFLTDILADMGIGFATEDLQTYDVINADEAWVPTSPYCLGPVVKINGSAVGDGRPGPVWRRVIDEWSRRVGKDIYAEITGSSES